MASFNKVMIIGYLGRDPELRHTPQGTAVCDFSVATTERRKDKTGEFQDVTTWFRVTFFGRQAEVAHQYLLKGRQVWVEGTLSLREWTDKDGATRTTLEVRGTDIQFLSPAPESESSQAAAAKASATPTTSRVQQTATAKRVVIEEEDIPF